MMGGVWVRASSPLVPRVSTAITLITFKEKECAAVGKRVGAVGMIFYRNDSLELGKTYKLRRQKNYPKDSNCIEIVDEYRRAKAVINRDVALLLAPLLDNGTLENAE
ncbi:hypothetical protein QZH41_014984, partial [Actinostola sp. cb2023]